MREATRTFYFSLDVPDEPIFDIDTIDRTGDQHNQEPEPDMNTTDMNTTDTLTTEPTDTLTPDEIQEAARLPGFGPNGLPRGWTQLADGAVWRGPVPGTGPQPLTADGPCDGFVTAENAGDE